MAFAESGDLLERGGPEDVVESTTVGHKESWRTGPTTSFKTAHGGVLTEADGRELATLTRFLTTEPYKGIVSSLAQRRSLCAKQALTHGACLERYPQHLAPSMCAGAAVDGWRCMVKVARKVQYECKPEVKALASCIRAGKGDDACFDEKLAFHMCTEEF